MNINLTQAEIEVLRSYLFRKIIKLEDAGLTDSHCYSLLYQVYNKIRED